MKKVLLTIASLAIMATSAMAFPGPGPIWQPTDFRNESYIVQTGTVSWASVSQYGDQSYSTISQKGFNDTATVIQSSDCCFAGGCGCGGSWLGFPVYTDTQYQNFSSIKQFGAGGFHDAYVNQKGDGNQSWIEQSGSKDSAKVVQDGGFNYSNIEQNGFGMNKAQVIQVGDLNTSFVDQGSGVNTALVDQNGFKNYSNIDQGAACGFGFNMAVVNQIGYMNYSDIAQSGNGSHTAYVNQANTCFTGSIPYCK